MLQSILMIEDDKRLAVMVETYLATNGYVVVHAPTGEAGLAALRGDARDPFAAVLLDLMLPDADGLDICRRIRALPPPADTVPIVMLTAKGDPFDRVVGLEMGADDYLPKPFEPRELLARLRAVLRRQRWSTRLQPRRSASADWKSIATPARSCSTGARVRSPRISSISSWPWRSARGACCRATSRSTC